MIVLDQVHKLSSLVRLFIMMYHIYKPLPAMVGHHKVRPDPQRPQEFPLWPQHRPGALSRARHTAPPRDTEITPQVTVLVFLVAPQNSRAFGWEPVYTLQKETRCSSGNLTAKDSSLISEYPPFCSQQRFLTDLDLWAAQTLILTFPETQETHKWLKTEELWQALLSIAWGLLFQC